MTVTEPAIEGTTVARVVEQMQPAIPVPPIGDICGTDEQPAQGGPPVDWPDTPAAVAALADRAAEATADAVESGVLAVAWDSDPEVWQEGWATGYSAGHAEGLAARPPRSVRIPVPMRHSVLAPGDAIEDRAGRIRMVHNVVAAREHPDLRWRAPQYRGRIIVELSRVDPRHGTLEYDADPDEPAQVLIPVAELDAMRQLRDALGAQAIAGRRSVIA